MDHSREKRGRLAHRVDDLEVYSRARKLAFELFVASQSWPREEKYSLVDQVRRSSRSVGAQLAEAWGKRRYVRSFTAKLVDARAEQLETVHWIETARDCSYLPANRCEGFREQLEIIGKQIDAMIAKARDFSRTA
ncbi:MAG: four helix bundle protein [Planctomycetota bacterium]